MFKMLIDFRLSTIKVIILGEFDALNDIILDCMAGSYINV